MLVVQLKLLSGLEILGFGLSLEHFDRSPAKWKAVQC